MRITVLPLALALIALLSACSERPAPASAPAAAPAPATEANAPPAARPVPPAAAAQTAPTATRAPVLYSPLPPGVEGIVPFHVRSDRFVVAKNGAPRRRAVLELLEGDAAAASAAVERQMTAAGYRKLETPAQPGAATTGSAPVTRLAFTRKGLGRVNVAISDAVGDQPAHPAARVRVSYDWPVQDPAAAAAMPGTR